VPERAAAQAAGGAASSDRAGRDRVGVAWGEAILRGRPGIPDEQHGQPGRDGARRTGNRGPGMELDPAAEAVSEPGVWSG